MLSFSKLYLSNSTSGPLTTEKPMETNASSNSSRTIFNGCCLPTGISLPASVTSTLSSSSFFFSSASRSCSFFSFIASSMWERTSFAICPITGLSSLESFPISERSAVTSPFLPRNLTRKDSSSSDVSDFPIFSSASLRTFISLSFKLILSPSFSLPSHARTPRRRI